MSAFSSGASEETATERVAVPERFRGRALATLKQLKGSYHGGEFVGSRWRQRTMTGTEDWEPIPGTDLYARVNPVTATQPLLAA